MSRLPKRFPVGTKYVVEASGEFVRRFVEYPDGRKIRLSTRKRQRCSSVEPVVSLAPDQTENLAVEVVTERRIFA